MPVTDPIIYDPVPYPNPGYPIDPPINEPSLPILPRPKPIPIPKPIPYPPPYKIQPYEPVAYV